MRVECETQGFPDLYQSAVVLGPSVIGGPELTAVLGWVAPRPEQTFLTSWFSVAPKYLPSKWTQSAPRGGTLDMSASGSFPAHLWLPAWPTQMHLA